MQVGQARLRTLILLRAVLYFNTMADSDLSLLFKIRGDNTSAKSAVADTRLALNQLRGSSTDLTGAMSVLSSATSALQGPMGGVASRISALTSIFREMNSAQSEATAGVASYAGQLTGAAGPVGAAILGAVAMAAALVTVGHALFEAARSAADFQGKMFDMAQQTGVTVETLSALEIVAKTTGGNIDSIAQSLVVFQGKLDEAQDSSSKAGKQFAELGISVENTEDAFRDALKSLAAMPTGFKQTNDAAELFGRRGGKQVLAILKETSGDLDGAIEKFRDMGILISTDTAAAADEFNDQLAITGFQLRAMGAILGSELMPLILNATKQVSKAISENREALHALAVVVKTVVEPAIVIFTRVLIDAANVISFVSRGFRMSTQVLYDLARGYNVAEAAARAYNNEAARSAVSDLGATGGARGIVPEMGIGTPTNPFRTSTRAPSGGGGGRGGGGGGASRAAADALRAAEEATREAQKQLDVYNNLVDELNKLDAELDGVSTATRVYAIEQNILNGVLKDAPEHIQEMALAAAKDADNKEKQLRLTKELAAYNETLHQQVREAIEGEKSQLRITQELIESMEKQGQVIPDATKAWMQISAGLVDAKANAEKLEPALRALSETLQQMPLSDTISKVLSDAQIDALESPPPPNFGPWEDAFSRLKEIGTDAMGSVVQGIGSMVQAWVLYGNAGPNAVRKMVASVLAGLAAQAAIEALMELARGFAALANPLMAWTAPAHFKAAAMFAAVAGGAAIAGRMVAGNSFSQGAGGGGGGTSGGSATSTAPSSIDVGRRKSEGISVNITMVGQATEGFRYMVEKAAIESVRSNGPMRRIQNGEDV